MFLLIVCFTMVTTKMVTRAMPDGESFTTLGPAIKGEKSVSFW